jgi:hypothetical protein
VNDDTARTANPAEPLIATGIEPVATPLLPYAVEPGFRLTSRHVRWGLVWLGAFLVFTGFLLNPLLELSPNLAMGIYGTPFGPIDAGSSDAVTRTFYGMEVAGFAGLFLLSQALFLFPRGRLTFRTTHSGRPMLRAAVGAAFAGMLLTFGLLAALLELTGGWERFLDPLGRKQAQFPWTAWLAMLLLWALWAAVFHHLWRNLDHRTAVSRLTRALVAGSILELFVAVPIHTWAVRKTDYDCYCARGSYTALVFGGTVLLWLFGPGVVLLVLRERRRLVRSA